MGKSEQQGLEKIFDKLKKGERVYDTGYGPGIVEKVTQRSAYIKLVANDKTARYDREHVDHFIRHEEKVKRQKKQIKFSDPLNPVYVKLKGHVGCKLECGEDLNKVTIECVAHECILVVAGKNDAEDYVECC